MSISPTHVLTFPQAILSPSWSPTSQIDRSVHSNYVTSPSRGVLSRLAFEHEQRKMQRSLSSTENKDSFIDSTPTKLHSTSSRIYCPENYKQDSYDKTEQSEVDKFSVCSSNDENENNCSLLRLIDSNNQLSPTYRMSSFGHEDFLDTWTLARVKSFIENQIPVNNRLCLNICDDQCNVQNLIDQQIKEYPALKPPNDVCIELIRLFYHVQIIFPPRCIRLYDNDYLLLAILCSNNQCAYVRTTTGWAYTDDETDYGASIIVDEISEMIDAPDTNIEQSSEQCLYLLKNASFLYYKLVE